MRIIITGGTGLIGQALTARLASQGHQVLILSRSPERAAHPPPASDAQAEVQIAQWDARTADGWTKFVNGADAIVNLAGASINRRWPPDYKRVIRDSRLDASRAVVQAVEQASCRPGVVVQASGTGYYGPRQDETVSEGASSGTGFLGQTAVAWEASTAPVEDPGPSGAGVRRVIIRSGVVLSAGGGALPRMVLPIRFFVGGSLGSGEQWLPWVHIADEVRAIQFLIETEAVSGPFNVTAPHPVTNAEFSRALGQAMRRPAHFPVPSFVLRLLLGEMSNVILEGQRAVPQRLLDLGFNFRFEELPIALRDLLD